MIQTLTGDLKKAVDDFIDFLIDENNNCLVVHGSAGCGKTTLIKHMADIVEKNNSMYALLLKKNTASSEFEMVLTATTNPAAAVLASITGRPTQTIHKLLGLNMLQDRNTGEERLIVGKSAGIVTNKLIIIDEASMVDDELFRFIIMQTRDCKLVLVGDQYQLAAVGQTKTTMETLQCPRISLNQVLRNDGAILEVSSLYKETVKTGIFKPLPKSNVAVKMVDKTTYQSLLDKAFTDPNYNLKEAKILAWTNKRVLEYNTYIRKLKGYPADFQPGEIVYTNKPINVGINRSIDSLVTITAIGSSHTNSYGVVGRNVHIDDAHISFLPDNPGAEKIVLQKLAKQKNWNSYFLIKESWLDLRLPYASTVHKSQGNEYKSVFVDLIDIGKCFNPSDVARLLYVAISRALKEVIFFGELPAKYAG